MATPAGKALKLLDEAIAAAKKAWSSGDDAALKSYKELRRQRDDLLSSGAKPDIENGTLVDALMRRANDPDLPNMDFRGGHTAPVDPEYNSPIHNLTETGTYPSDVYGPNGLRYYGGGAEDKAAFDVFERVHGKPDEMVDIYRAVPPDAPDEILPGDWVTTTKDYADMHGLGLEDYKILQGRTEAKRLRTDGNSPHEFGYTGNARPDLLAGTALGTGAAAAALRPVFDERGRPTDPEHGDIRAPEHPTVLKLADALSKISSSVEGSPAELFAPEATADWLRKLAYKQTPNWQDRIGVLGDFL